ncbi:hypothetical protein CYMTET_5430 [Cymbomonas tetramitiformis]|uniref:Ubiquitin-like domain-containing protein n=1 Tax=Cymbomonas tetramitiformis TaxID=36881 RepID=A0AAE0LJ30_9CHLO|nr:hypothetical protein CYMTET_5430 [Cymbomonas tetramitiformis]
MLIHVKTDFDKVIPLEVIESIERVENIKEKLLRELGVPLQYQRLTFAGKGLENGHTLRESGVFSSQKPTLHLQISVNVSVRQWSGDTLRLEFESSLVTVHEVKVNIQEKESLHTHAMRLLFGGRTLEDCRCLRDYGIEMEAFLDLRLENQGDFLPDNILGLAFGTMEGGDPASTYGNVAAALEVGFRHFDLAERYKTQGHVGRALHTSGLPRKELWLTNKIDGLPSGDYSSVRARVEAMLAEKRLAGKVETALVKLAGWS